MSIPRVVLIGGPPFIGKSSVARCIASRFQYGCLSTDDLSKAVGVTCRDIIDDPMAGLDWRDYFSETTVDQLLDHWRASCERLWPALEFIIKCHSTWDDPIVIEGYTFMPDRIVSTNFSSTGALWLSGETDLYESRIRSSEGFYRGARDEEKLVEHVLNRSVKMDELMMESAERCDAETVAVTLGDSVDDVADMCVERIRS